MNEPVAIVGIRSLWTYMHTAHTLTHRKELSTGRSRTWMMITLDNNKKFIHIQWMPGIIVIIIIGRFSPFAACYLWNELLALHTTLDDACIVCCIDRPLNFVAFRIGSAATQIHIVWLYAECMMDCSFISCRIITIVSILCGLRIRKKKNYSNTETPNTLHMKIEFMYANH